MTTAPGLIYDMPEHVYHARPELSSTGVRRLLDSPRRFQWDRKHRVGSVAFDVGHAIHTKILGVGGSTVTYPAEHLTPSGAISTKAATVAWVEAQRAAGLVPLTPNDAHKVDAMAEAVLAHPEARRILETPGGRPEVSAFATDPDTGVNVRARFDWLTDDLAADVKTTAGSASPTGFGATAAKFGYPIQEAHYIDTLEWVTGQRVPLQFIVVEKHAPHLVAVHDFGDVTRLVARDLAAQARSTYAECVATDRWPGYSDQVIETQIPAWWFYQADEDQEEMAF